MTHPILARLRGRLIVSCQALPGSPLRDSTIIAALAQCAERGGAGGVRSQPVEDAQSRTYCLSKLGCPRPGSY